MFDWRLMVDLLPLFGDAALRTLVLLGTAFVGGMVLGFAWNWVHQLRHRPLVGLYWSYVGLMRGMPFLMLLFIAYFGLPSVGIQLSPFWAAAVSLSLYSGAYFAEIFRACWQSIPAGQIEAARVIGMTRWQVFRHIQAPQAMRTSVPLLSNQMVLLLKDCALASVITFPELAMTTSKVVSEQFVYLEPYLLLALCYWGIALSIDAMGRYLSRHFRLQGASR